MAASSNIRKQGSIREEYADGVAILPNRRLVYKDDGSIEGTVTFECDKDDARNLPGIGSLHPDDNRCELYAQDITFLTLGKIRMVGSYIGLNITESGASETDPQYQVTTATDRLAIELHPDFSDFAGTAAAPLNGAKFDESTGEFLGFFDPANALFGSSAFFSPSYQVTKSFWSRNEPSPKRLLTVVDKLDGLKKPENVKNLMLIGTPYRKIGSHYQVSEQWLGSGPGGWNPTIYPQ